MHWIWYWIIGYVISLGVGHFLTRWLLDKIREKTGCYGNNWKKYTDYADKLSKLEDEKFKYDAPKIFDFSPALQGILERLFFTTMLGASCQF